MVASTNPQLNRSDADQETVRRCRVFAAAGVLGVAACFVVPAGTMRTVGYLLVGLSSVVAIGVGVRAHRPDGRAAWYLLAAGLTAWTAADVLYNIYDLLGISPFPSVADVFYLGGYWFLTLGLAVMVRHRKTTRDTERAIDSAIVAAALGLLSWVVLSGPVTRAPDQSTLELLVGLAYPVCDIVLFALLVRLLGQSGERRPAFCLLSAAVGLTLVGDYAFAILSLKADFEVGYVDVLFLLSYVLWGTAALHPSMATLTQPGTVGGTPYTRRRLGVLGVAILAAPAALGTQLLLGLRPDIAATTIASTVLFALVVARMDAAIRAVTSSTRQRDQLADHLAHQSSHDQLTQVTNRARVIELIEAALHRARRGHTLVGLLYVDLDGFKRVNDAFGHRVGDDVLREVATRVTAHVRTGDTVGRLAGDEFVVLVEPLRSQSALLQLAERLVAALAEPMHVAGRVIVSSASVGVAVNRDGDTDAGALLHAADVAAGRAKAAGRGRAEVFDDALRRELGERAALEKALRKALAEDELLLHYQPVVDLARGHVIGYEALVRWERPGHGLVPPDTFIPTAERSRLIRDLDMWVLREATRQLAQWTADDPELFGTLTVAVNISGRHVADPNLVNDVASALADADLAPERLVLEITETTLVADPRVPARLEALRHAGVGVSIDDFGTGYTSIGQLQHLHADTLKIDKSLVASTSPGGIELLRLVIRAAHAFGLRVVAEGVEYDHHVATLKREGCDSAQGYYFCPPRPPHDMRRTTRAIGAHDGSVVPAQRVTGGR